jgi:hypothetical protein
LSSDPAVISSTEVITVDDLYLVEWQTFVDGTVITLTRSITDNHVITRTAMYTTGRGILADTGGYTETHVLHVVGFDAAGNQAESEGVRIYTIHRPEEEEEETATPTAMLPTNALAWGSQRAVWARLGRHSTQTVARSAVAVEGACTPTGSVMACWAGYG